MFSKKIPSASLHSEGIPILQSLAMLFFFSVPSFFHTSTLTSVNLQCASFLLVLFCIFLLLKLFVFCMNSHVCYSFK